MRKAILCLIILSQYYLAIVQAQNATYIENIQKYWNYRYHLVGDHVIKNQYMPWEADYRHKLGEPGMMVVGENAGQSIPATSIQLYNIPDNPLTSFDEYSYSNWQAIDVYPPYLPRTNNPLAPPNVFETGKFCENVYFDHAAEVEDRSGIINIDDQTPGYLANYITVLATEWRLLKNNNLPTANTEYELYLALHALLRLDSYSSTLFAGETQNPNGFFYRADIPYDLAFGDNFGPNDLVSAWGACTNGEIDCMDGGVYREGKNGTMSQDNSIYILNALAFVTTMLDNGVSYNSNDLREMAKGEADLICRYIRDAHVGSQGYSKHDWRIVDPDNKKVCKGSQTIAWSYMFAKATRRIVGHPNPNAYQNFLSSLIGVPAWVAFSLYVQGVLRYGTTIGPMWTTVQGTLLASTGNLWPDNTGPTIAALAAYEENGYSLDKGPNLHLDLINSVLNSKTPGNTKQYYEDILSQFPCFSMPRNVVGDASTEAYTELDYMLLFNLYSLAFPQNAYYNLEDWGSVGYNNLLDRDITASFPKVFPNQGNPVVVGGKAQPAHVQAAQSLTLEAKLSSGAAVNFSAPHVTMMPGFVANYGSVSVIENARMDCTAEEFYTTGGTVFNAAKTDETANQEEEEWSEDSVRFYMKELKAFLMNPDVDQEMKEDIREAMKQFAPLDSMFAAMYDFDLKVYPNPFNSGSQVSFSIPKTTYVSIAIYDLSGRLMKTISEHQLTESGIHTLAFDRDGISSGVYVLSFNDTNGNRSSKQISIF